MLKLKKIGIEIIKEYAKKLNITVDDAEKIILHNKSAQIFLTGESDLRMRNNKLNLSILLRTTLFREFSDFECIRLEELKMIKKYYGIYIKPIYLNKNKYPLKMNLKNYKNFINDCLECDAEIEEINDYIDEWVNGEYECDLFEFLGMTQDEYNYWKQDESEAKLKIIIYCHEYGKDFNEVIYKNNKERMVARAKNVEELKEAINKVKEIRGINHESEE